MSRLIDADVLMEILTTAIRNMKGIAKFLDAEDDPEIQMEIKAYMDIANGIKDMPTIKPEQKKGEWILADRDDVPTGLMLRCSECNCEEHSNNAVYYSFCPNCGADMRGDDRNEI